jgi:hypothetical protein
MEVFRRLDSNVSIKTLILASCLSYGVLKFNVFSVYTFILPYTLVVTYMYCIVFA